MMRGKPAKASTCAVVIGRGVKRCSRSSFRPFAWEVVSGSEQFLYGYDMGAFVVYTKKVCAPTSFNFIEDLTQVAKLKHIGSVM